MKRKISNFLSGILILGVCVAGYGQVANNGIAERIHLSPEDTPTQSTTAESTVEWECISRTLTSKCIVYHNDQWFTFSAPDPGTYFINIKNQVCKDLYGIQMIIIEGNPCDTENYIIKRCISKLRMDDMFVELGMLKANQLYLLNIDGFLGDYCSFEIQLSRKPAGIPERITRTDTLQFLSGEENQVNISWYATDSLLSITRNFEVYRKKLSDKKYGWLGIKNIQSNAVGTFSHAYEYTDSVKEYGVYEYLVLAKGDTCSSTVLSQQFSWREKKKLPINHSVMLSFTFSKPGPVDVLIMDPVNKWVLKQYGTEFTFQNPTIELSLFPFFTNGMREVSVSAKNSKTREVNNFRFVLTESEWQLRQPK